MRPTEGSSSYVREMELSSWDFFNDLAVLVVESRLPEEKMGRKCGVHSWPLTHKSVKKCCQASDIYWCKLVVQTRDRVVEVFDSGCMFIEVVCNAEAPLHRVSVTQDNSCHEVLLETWKVQLFPNKASQQASGHMVLQAVRSYLHFSQLSAWWSKTNGALPSNVQYRISGSTSVDFMKPPTTHTFPRTEVSRDEYVQVSVSSLPRIDLHVFNFLLNQTKNIWWKNHNHSPPQQQARWRIDKISPPGDICAVDKNKSLCPPKRKDDDIDLYFKETCRPANNCQSSSYVGEKHFKRCEDDTPTKNSPSMQLTRKGLAELLKDFDLDNAGASAGCACPSAKDNNSMKQRKCRSKSISPHFSSRHSKDTGATPARPIAARRIIMGSTTPIFNVNTGLPLSSSPAPIKRRERKLSDVVSGSNSSDECSRAPVMLPCGLSKSAPASTNLLGNFEESVLKGRMPVNGTLEGFRAKLGASGAFCPKHITLPMKVQYFQLAEDKSIPSPYLGYINLRESKQGKRYRVPKKGTVQLTVFNPNNTVVKVFVVLFNYEDMPPSTKTFIRQRVYSVRNDAKTMGDIQTLHYLVHLSFMASKRSHIYLHTAIQILFPQQTPDARLYTITDGPSDPKYTPVSSSRHKIESDEG